MAKRVTGKEQLYHLAIPAMLKLLSESGPAGSPDHPMAELIIQSYNIENADTALVASSEPLDTAKPEATPLYILIP